MPELIDYIGDAIRALETQIEVSPLGTCLRELRQLKERHLQNLSEIKQPLGQPSMKPSRQVEVPLNPGPIEKQEEERQSTPTAVLRKTAIEIISAYGRPMPTLLLLEALNERGVVVERYSLMRQLFDSDDVCLVGDGWWITTRKSEFTRY